MVYWSPGLKSLWDQVTASLGNGHSPRFIQGSAGSGKSQFLQLLALRSIEQGHNCAYVDAAEQQLDLFETLSQAYGLDYPSKSEEQYLTWFESFLASSRLGGIQNILLLDNLHRMDQGALQKLVYLAKIRIDNTPLLHVVATLDPNLDQGALDHLADNKIDTRALTLPPLNESETGEYLRHRLRKAGHPDGGLFDPDVVAWLHGKSRGLPREINYYADLLLTHAFIGGEARVGAALIKAVDPSYRPSTGKKRLGSKPSATPLDILPSHDQETPQSVAVTGKDAQEAGTSSNERTEIQRESKAVHTGATTTREKREAGHSSPRPSTVEVTDALDTRRAPDTLPRPEPHETRPTTTPAASPDEKGAVGAPVKKPSAPEGKAAPSEDNDNADSGEGLRASRGEKDEEIAIEVSVENEKDSRPTPPGGEGGDDASARRRWLFISAAAVLILFFAGVVMWGDGMGPRQEEQTAHTSKVAIPVTRTPAPEAAQPEESQGDTSATSQGEPQTAESEPEAPTPQKASQSSAAERKEKRPERPTAPPPETASPAKTQMAQSRADKPSTATRPEPEHPRKAPAERKPPAAAPSPSAPARHAEPKAPIVNESTLARTETRRIEAAPSEPAAPAPAQEQVREPRTSEFARFSPPENGQDTLIPLQELDNVVHRFQWAYENGDENLLGELFDPAIRTNESNGRDNILNEYRQFFRITQARRLEIGPIEWQTSGMVATGVGHFVAHIVTAKGKERTFTGTLTIETVNTPDGPRISALFYRYDG